MTDCDYCGASFGDEDAHLDHLREEHLDELGPIDKRRVGAADGDDGLPTAPVALGAVVVAAAAIVGYVIFVAGGSGGGTVNGFEVQQTPTGEPSQASHYHGPMNMTVNGERVDFSQDKYQQNAVPFHFERGNGDRWHVHTPGVTLEYGMATLDIGVTEDSVTFRNTTYEDSDEGTTVVVEVNGNGVDPADYVLREGDRIHIAVRS